MNEIFTSSLVLLCGMFLSNTVFSNPIQQQFDKLMAKVSAEGNVRVIVDVTSGNTALLGIGIKSKNTGAKKKIIQNAQNNFLNKMSADSMKSVKRFKHLPYIAMEVDSKGLQTLISIIGLDSIMEDTLMAPMLTDSVPLTGADVVNSANFDGNGMAIAVLDTGVDKDHPMFQNNIVAEACFSTTSLGNNSTTLCPNGLETHIGENAGINCATSIPGCDHGTHVAGIAGGNSPILGGVARRASVISIQVFSRFDGSVCSNFGLVSPCSLTFISDQIQALSHVLSLSNTITIAAVNLSLGGGQHTSSEACDIDIDFQVYRSVIEALRDNGIATVAASGNNGFTDATGFPACLSNVVSVGSTSKSDIVANSSNSAPWVSLLAPGVQITSASVGEGFEVKSGTSMATPHVAGAWAVLKSKWPQASVSEILTALQNNSPIITDARNGLGIPRIQLDEAIFEYLAVQPGFNLVGVDVSETGIIDTFGLLPLLGPPDSLVKLERLDTAQKLFQETFYDIGSQPAGDNGVLQNNEGWLVYSTESNLLRNENHIVCSEIQLNAGVNVVAFPCMRFGKTAYDLLQAMATMTTVATIQTFDNVAGRFQTASLSVDQIPVGIDFTIDNAKAYLIGVDSNLVIQPN